MGDCENVEIRELLPERVAGRLDRVAGARVDAHVAACSACRGELAVLEGARRVMHGAVRVDADRIGRAVLAATSGVAAPSRRRSSRWSAIRMAASIALAAAGLTTFGIWRGTWNEPTRPTAVVRPVPAAVAGLAPAGSLADLDDAQLNALLDDLAAFDAAPAAEPEAVVPQLEELVTEELP